MEYSAVVPIILKLSQNAEELQKHATCVRVFHRGFQDTPRRWRRGKLSTVLHHTKSSIRDIYFMAALSFRFLSHCKANFQNNHIIFFFFADCKITPTLLHGLILINYSIPSTFFIVTLHCMLTFLRSCLAIHVLLWHAPGSLARRAVGPNLGVVCLEINKIKLALY